MCVYATAYGYVFDVGGRPRFSWPSFVVPSVSFAMMSGTLAVHAVFLFVNRLPRLNHPAFNIPGFGRVTQDRYFLAAEARGAGFDAARIERQLAALPEGAGRPLAIRAGAAMRRRTLALGLSRPRPVLALAGCGEANMRDQAKAKTWDANRFFPQGMTMREPVAGTVPRIDPAALRAPPGRHRRGPAGPGPGALRHRLHALPRPQRRRAGHDRGARLSGGRRPSRRAPEGGGSDRLYAAITQGHGAMFPMGAQVAPADRWAIVAYVRALQLSQGAEVASLPAEDRARLRGGADAGGPMTAARPLLRLARRSGRPRPRVLLGDWQACYLAAWLCLLALPLGALPLVAGLDALAPERFAILRPRPASAASA